MLGIDASQYDTFAGTDWKLAASRGIRWASVRAVTTDWKSRPIVDSAYKFNVDACIEAGIKVMSYAWIDPLGNFNDQADLYLKTRDPRTSWDMVDLEDSGRFRANAGTHVKVWQWMEDVSLSKVQEIVAYTNQDYTLRYLQKAHWISLNPLFIANWEQPAPRIALPFTPEWAAWQYTGKGSGEYYGFSVPGFTIKQIALATMRKDFFDAAQ